MEMTVDTPKSPDVEQESCGETAGQKAARVVMILIALGMIALDVWLLLGGVAWK